MTEFRGKESGGHENVLKAIDIKDAKFDQVQQPSLPPNIAAQKLFGDATSAISDCKLLSAMAKSHAIDGGELNNSESRAGRDISLPNAEFESTIKKVENVIDKLQGNLKIVSISSKSQIDQQTIERDLCTRMDADLRGIKRNIIEVKQNIHDVDPSGLVDKINKMQCGFEAVAAKADLLKVTGKIPWKMHHVFMGIDQKELKVFQEKRGDLQRKIEAVEPAQEVVEIANSYYDLYKNIKQVEASVRDLFRDGPNRLQMLQTADRALSDLDRKIEERFVENSTGYVADINKLSQSKAGLACDLKNVLGDTLPLQVHLRQFQVSLRDMAGVEAKRSDHERNKSSGSSKATALLQANIVSFWKSFGSVSSEWNDFAKSYNHLHKTCDELHDNKRQIQSEELQLHHRLGLPDIEVDDQADTSPFVCWESTGKPYAIEEFDKFLIEDDQLGSYDQSSCYDMNAIFNEYSGAVIASPYKFDDFSYKHRLLGVGSVAQASANFPDGLPFKYVGRKEEGTIWFADRVYHTYQLVHKGVLETDMQTGLRYFKGIAYDACAKKYQPLEIKVPLADSRMHTPGISYDLQFETFRKAYDRKHGRKALDRYWYPRLYER